MGSVRGSRDPVVSALHRGVCGNRSDSGCDGARRTTRESSATIAFRPSDDGTASHARTWRRAGVADSATAAAGARKLNTAVAEATAATWDLARSASEPAARISRQVLDAATQADQDPSLHVGRAWEPNAAGALVPSLTAPAPDTAAAETALRQVGDRLASGVRPLSDTARMRSVSCSGQRTPKPRSRLIRQRKGSLMRLRTTTLSTQIWNFLSRPAATVIAFLFLFVLENAAGAETPPRKVDALLRLVDPSAAVVLTVEGLGDQANAFLKSRLAADLQQLPTVKEWFDSEKFHQFERHEPRSRPSWTRS